MTLIDKLFATLLFIVVCFALGAFAFVSVTMTPSIVVGSLILFTYSLLLGLVSWMYWISVIID